MGLENFINISLNKLVKASWNYKLDDSDILNKLKNNIKNNGQVQNLIVREIDNNTYEVVNGNHRLQALSELNVKEAICYNLGKIPENLAKKIAIETNETRFENDTYKLAETIKEVTDTFLDSKDTLPFTEIELQTFKELIEDTYKDLDYEDQNTETEYEEDLPEENQKTTIIIEFDDKHTYEKELKILSKKYKIVN